MSLFIPKPKPLYAPMLATFGGGSVTGFRAGGALDAQGIADALVSGDTSVLTDDNMAIMTIDEAAMETVLASATASTNFYDHMLVQVYRSTNNSFNGGTSTTVQSLSYYNSLSPGLTVTKGYKAHRQGTGAPDAAVYVFKNFHTQGDKFSYYHEGFNGYDQSNTPHFAGFINSGLTNQFQNRGAIYSYNQNPGNLAYSQNQTSGVKWQGYSHLPTGFSSSTNQSVNQGYIFALTAPNPASYQYFFVGVASDDGSTSGRTHKSHVAPLYAAKNGFT